MVARHEHLQSQRLPHQLEDHITGRFKGFGRCCSVGNQNLLFLFVRTELSFDSVGWVDWKPRFSLELPQDYALGILKEYVKVLAGRSDSKREIGNADAIRWFRILRHFEHSGPGYRLAIDGDLSSRGGFETECLTAPRNGSDLLRSASREDDSGSRIAA